LAFQLKSYHRFFIKFQRNFNIEKLKIAGLNFSYNSMASAPIFFQAESKQLNTKIRQFKKYAQIKLQKLKSEEKILKSQIFNFLLENSFRNMDLTTKRATKILDTFSIATLDLHVRTAPLPKSTISLGKRRNSQDFCFLSAPEILGTSQKCRF